MITPVSALAPNSGLGFSWGDLFENATDTTFDILKGQYGVPEGTYIQTSPNGQQVIYRQPTGNQQNVFSSTGVVGGLNMTSSPGGFSTGNLLLIGGGVLLLVMMMGRR